MTLAPYILSLLLILTFISTNHIKERQAITTIHAAYLPLKAQQQRRRNASENELYHRYVLKHRPASPRKPTKPLHTPSLPKTKKRTTRETFLYESERRERRTASRSRLNLASADLNSPIRALATNLIVALYRDTLLFQNNESYLRALAPLIVNHLITHQLPMTSALNELRKTHPILYKMLRGANHRYPPLGDFLTVDPSAGKPIHFHFASAPLLDALFDGPRLRHIFDALEKKKWEAYSRYPYVRKSEAFAILKKENQLPRFEKFETYITFGR